ncbi:MAG: hypothetical protein ACOYL8_00280 [Patescibacteria group bacterium]
MLDEKNAGFESKLLAKIKECKICPKPRWQFLLKDYTVWLAGILSLIIGSAAISVMIYLFKFNDWEIYEQTKKSFLEFFILTLPYFWFVFLGIFVLIISYNLKHTKSGYRYTTFYVIGASVILSIILGTIFFFAGLGEKLDNILGSQAPFYDQVINRHVDFWSKPSEGRLSGVVIGIDDGGKFILIDRGGEEWLVNTEKSQPFTKEIIIISQPIRLLGEETDDHEFSAVKILPMNAGRNFFNRLNGMMSPMKQKMKVNNLPPVLIMNP